MAKADMLKAMTSPSDSKTTKNFFIFSYILLSFLISHSEKVTIVLV